MERRVFVCERRGLSGLVARTEELSELAPHEVRVQVKAIGLNFADVFSILGMYTAAPKRPFVPGLEFAGVVDAVGCDVTAFKIGERVMGVQKFGAYATALNVDARLVRRIPDNWSIEEGAAYLVAHLTAYYGLIDQCRLRQGETVLIQSAAGAVGLAALHIAKAHGCFVIGAVGSEAKRAFCLQQGYNECIVRGHQFKHTLRTALGDRPLDVVMETMGGATFEDSYELLAPRGRIALYGYAQYMPHSPLSYLSGLWRYVRRPRVDTFRLNNRLVAGFNLIYLFDHVDDMGRYVDELLRLCADKPHIGATYSFDELPKALEALKSGKTVGKMVVTV
jgi:NADPH:quinone reductase-like Zn-dependent oxidoreductase